MRPCGVLIKPDTALPITLYPGFSGPTKTRIFWTFRHTSKRECFSFDELKFKMCLFVLWGNAMANLKREYVQNGPTLKTQSLPMVYWDHIKPTKKHCCTHMVRDACFLVKSFFAQFLICPLSLRLPLWYSCLNAIQIVAPTTKSSKSDNMSNKISRLPHLSQFQRKFIQIETLSRVKFRKKCSGLQLHVRRQAFAVLILISRMISCCDLAQK